MTNGYASKVVIKEPIRQVDEIVKFKVNYTLKMGCEIIIGNCKKGQSTSMTHLQESYSKHKELTISRVQRHTLQGLSRKL